MLSIEFSEEDKQTLLTQRFHHPGVQPRYDSATSCRKEEVKPIQTAFRLVSDFIPNSLMHRWQGRGVKQESHV
jgi:hypothetical protein